jgi:integrase
MAGKQAKLLTPSQMRLALSHVRHGRYPERDRVILLLSFKAGLRAGEIAQLTWPMVLDPGGLVGDRIELHDVAAKKGSGRAIPMHPLLRSALTQLSPVDDWTERVIRSERGDRLRASSIVNWFAQLYRELGLAGCSSHSGRRTFITRAARLVFKAQGSLRDVQQLAGHSSIDQTQAYIEGDSLAKRRLVAML